MNTDICMYNGLYEFFDCLIQREKEAHIQQASCPDFAHLLLREILSILFFLHLKTTFV